MECLLCLDIERMGRRAMERMGLQAQVDLVLKHGA